MTGPHRSLTFLDLETHVKSTVCFSRLIGRKPRKVYLEVSSILLALNPRNYSIALPEDRLEDYSHCSGYYCI